MYKVNEEKLLDILYEFRSDNLTIDAEIKNEIYEKEEKLTKLLKKYIKNKRKYSEVFEKLNDFEGAIMSSIVEETKAFYKAGHFDSNELKNEVITLALLKINDVKDTSFIDAIYEDRVNELAELSEEDKKHIKKSFEKIKITEILPNINQEELDRIMEYLDSKLDDVYYEMAYFCHKYYKNGFKNGVVLKYECK